jgi:hypothetical protein
MRRMFYPRYPTHSKPMDTTAGMGAVAYVAHHLPPWHTSSTVSEFAYPVGIRGNFFGDKATGT